MVNITLIIYLKMFDVIVFELNVHRKNMWLSITTHESVATDRLYGMILATHNRVESTYLYLTQTI